MYHQNTEVKRLKKTHANFQTKKVNDVKVKVTSQLHPDNMSGEEGVCLRKSWKPFIRTLNDRRKALSRHWRILVLFSAHYFTHFLSSLL
jgi:hypothetical protein